MYKKSMLKKEKRKKHCTKDKYYEINFFIKKIKT